MNCNVAATPWAPSRSVRSQWAFSSALPGLSSFVSEFLVLVGTFERYVWAGIIATLGIIYNLGADVSEGSEDLRTGAAPDTVEYGFLRSVGL